jgi:G protein beta subunit-like protein
LAVTGNPHVRLYEINTSNPSQISSFDGHTGNVTAVGFQKDSKWMFTASEDGTVKIWDLRAPGCQRNYESRTPINSACLHPNQVRLFLATRICFCLAKYRFF